MDRSILDKPFPWDVVRTRPGAFGDELRYVEAPAYIRRLNEAFDANWSWTISDYQIRDAEVIVHGVLAAAGVSKHAFGGATITTNRNGETVSLADNLKAAATDAMKKACSLLGLGLDLHNIEQRSESRSATDVAEAPSAKSSSRAVANGRTGRESRSETRSQLTEKQLRALYALARSRGMSSAAFKELSVERYGTVPESLTRRDASSFIDQLSQ